MTTQTSSKLAALGAALLINAMMLSSVAMLFGTQARLHLPTAALVHTSAAPAGQSQV